MDVSISAGALDRKLLEEILFDFGFRFSYLWISYIFSILILITFIKVFFLITPAFMDCCLVYLYYVHV